ncbi:MAG: hypothetical protein V4692_07305, partial [Bdellovibrionota bacterium]
MSSEVTLSNECRANSNILKVIIEYRNSIFDRFGRLSSDPSDLAAGLGVPIGGHKGYALNLVLETLAGIL